MPELHPPAHTSAVRILLLAGDADLRELVRTGLGEMAPGQLSLECTGTLGDALARLARGDVDLVLTDLDLPDSKGLDTLDSLKLAGDRPSIVLADDRDPALREAVIAHGACGLLNKNRLDRSELERLARLAAMQAVAMRSLRESEARFGSLVKISGDWYWEQDEQFRFTAFSGPGAAAISGGGDVSRYLGKTRWELGDLEPVDGDWSQHRAQLERHEPFRDLVLRRRMSDGTLRYMSVSGEPVFGQEGCFKGYRGSAKDVTEKVRAEQAFLAAERRFRFAIDATADGVYIIDYETMRPTDVNEAGCRGLGYTREEFLRLEIEDYAPALKKDALRRLYEGLFAAPGTVQRAEIVNRRKDGTLIQMEIHCRGVVIDGRRFVVDVVRDITERKRTEEALRESEARFRGLTALASDYYWETDAEHRFTQSTRQRQGHAGNRSGSVIGKTRWEIPSTHPDAAGWDVHRATLNAHLPFRDFQIARIDESGVERHIAISGEPMFDAGDRFCGYRGVASDITERKRAEQELHRFRVAMDQSGDMIVLVDRETMRYVDVNRTACELLGYSREELLAMGPQDMLPVSRAELERAYDALIADPSSVDGINSDYLCKDGSHLSFESTRRAIHSGGKWIIAVVARDIRERIAAEAAQRESEARFRQTFELAATGIAHVSLDKRFLQVNARLCELLGRREDEIVGRPVDEFSHPEDRSLMTPKIAGLLRGEVQSVHGEKRFLRQDGSVAWVALTIAMARDAAGEPQHRISIFEDITERKAREAALHRFRTALDGSADMVLLIDMDSQRIIDLNETACSSLGYQRAELLGRSPEMILLGHSSAELLASQNALREQRGRADSVVRKYRRKDGATFEVEVLRRIIDSPDGPILVVNARDLTERRRAEEMQRMRLRYEEKIARFGRTALTTREVAELVSNAVQYVLEGLGSGAVAYLERAPGECQVVLRGVAGLDAGERELAAVACYAPRAALAHVLESGEPAILNAPSLDAPPLPFDWAKGLRCAVLVPVPGDRGIRGALCALHESQGETGPEEARFLTSAATLLSAALQRIDSEQQLAFLAQFDGLTGLPNRALLADRFGQMIVQARRHGRPLGTLFIDLDDFKLVNDSLGHAGGDALLKETAQRLQSAVRGGDTVARIAGDEFAIILADLARPEDAALVAQKVIEQLAAPVEVRGQEVFVTASIGIATFPADGEDAEALLGAADAAMYRAKQSGRNAYQFFTADINQRSRARAQLGTELRRALERDEFALAYQPKFDLQHAAPCGAEALLRWRHPERGMIQPAEFIPVLEESGLIVAVGERVLQQVCKDLKSWQAAGLAPLPVAVNLSARQFRQQDLGLRIRSLVKSAGVDPKLIELEITESHLMQDPAHAIRVMRSLSEVGIRIAIDDFGTGYSSLSYLTRFPVSALKIDRSFVADVQSEAADAAIVRTIIDMAHTLCFTVIAEGVETEAQAAFLRGLGCEQAQGYLFARPMPADDLKAFLCPAGAIHGVRITG